MGNLLDLVWVNSSGLAVAMRQGALQLRDLHVDTTGPDQGRRRGDFFAIHRVCEHYILETTIWSVMSLIVCHLHNT